MLEIVVMSKYNIKNVVIKLLQITFVVLIFTIGLNSISNAQVTPTTCYKNGQIVSWLDCLTNDSDKNYIDKIKSNIPFTAYQNYFEKQIKSGISPEPAFNKTIQRIILDIIGLIGGIIVVGIIAMFGISVLQYATARDNDEAMKKSKKRVRAVFTSLIIVIVLLFIGQFIAAILEVGSIFDIELFKISTTNLPDCSNGGPC